MTTQVPLLEIPRKSTVEIDFKPSFSAYIESFYQEDSSKYSSQIAKINQLRKEMIMAGRDLSGRDACYKYFGQLELVSLRFPIQEDTVKIEFVWHDAFTSTKISQFSVAFEKASVLFNVGATCSAIGALADRSSPQGLKTAYNYFQVAAGMFQYINDNFLHPPSVDLSRDSITVIVELMLTQAQESFIEKVLSENKSGLLVSKLAMYAGNSYVSIGETMLQPSLKNQWNPNWLALLKAKSKYFMALAYLHRSIVAESNAEYGQIVTFLQSAEKHIKDAVKSTESFLSVFGITAFLPSSLSPLTGGPATPKALTIPSLDTFIETCTTLAATISTKLKISIKDNDMIYNASIPIIDTLPALEHLKAVKCLQFQDLVPDLGAVIGRDLFDSLVPITVHVSASVYSDAKDGVMRKVRGIMTEMEGEQVAILRSLDVESVKRVKAILDGNKSNSFEIPKDLFDSISNVGMEEKRGGVGSIVTQINTTAEEARKAVDEVMQILDNEQYENEQMRIKYVQGWSMEPSSVQNGHIRGDVRTNDTKLQQLAGQRQLLVSKVSGLRNFLELTKLPHSSLTAKFFGEVDQPAVKSPVSLLDESVADSDQTPERNLVAKILSMVDRLRLITKDSKLCVEELGRRIQADDISSILMLNVGREEEIYKAELQKFSQFERQMEAMTRESQQILAQVGEGISLLQQTSKTWMKMEKTDRNSKGLTRQWESDLVVYIETKSSLEGHSLALRDVNRGLARARNAAINFANQRLIERQNLAGRIDSNQAEASQRALRAQLDRLQVEGSTNNSYLQNNMSSTPSPVVQTSLPPPTYGLPQPGLSKPQEQSSSPYSISQSQYGAQNTLPSPNAGSLSQMPSYSTTQGSQAFSGPSLSQHQVYNPAPSNFSHLQSNPISPQTNYSQNSSLPPPSVKLYSANQYSQPVQQQPPSQSLYSSQKGHSQNQMYGYQPQPQYPPANQQQQMAYQQYPPVTQPQQPQSGQNYNPSYPNQQHPPRPPQNLLD